MVSTKPALVICPGCWCPPTIYDDIVNPLRSLGYEVQVVNHKSNQVPANPPPTFQDDVEQISGIYRRLVDQGKEIVSIVHSYGGYCGTEAAKGFSKDERRAAGLEGGVSHFVCLAALIPKVDLPLSEFVPGMVRFTQVYDLPWITLAPEAKYELWNDLPREKADELGRNLVGISALVFTGVPTWPAFKHIPVTYVESELDFCIKETQKVFIDFLKEESKYPLEIIKIQAGHMAMNSKPEVLVRCIRKAAGEEVIIGE